MPEEIEHLVEAMQIASTDTLAGRTYHLGSLAGRRIVLAQCRVGKAAASVSSTHLLTRFGASSLVFTGVAGGVAPEVRVGDVIVGSELAQHDMDASPLFPPMEIPLTGQTWFRADPAISAALAAGGKGWAAEGRPGLDRADHFEGACVREGRIISGDRFVSSAEEVRTLADRIPKALAVEMEGAAVAQVCTEHGVPFGVVRIISDTADDHAADHFTESLGAFAGIASLEILTRALSGPTAG